MVLLFFKGFFCLLRYCFKSSFLFLLMDLFVSKFVDCCDSGTRYLWYYSLHEGASFWYQVCSSCCGTQRMTPMVVRQWPVAVNRIVIEKFISSAFWLHKYTISTAVHASFHNILSLLLGFLLWIIVTILPAINQLSNELLFFLNDDVKNLRTLLNDHSIMLQLFRFIKIYICQRKTPREYSPQSFIPNHNIFF